MKKFSAIALALLALVFSIPAQATIEVQDQGTREGNVSAINFGTGLSGSKSGGTYTVIQSGTPELTSIILEGATADAFEMTLSAVDPTADQTFALPDDSGYAMFSTLATNKSQAANSIWFASNAELFEGATADAFETTLAPADATADQTATIPNFASSFAIVGSTLTTNTLDAANSAWFESGALVFEGATANGFEGRMTASDWTADQVHTLPDMTGAIFMSTLTTNNLDAANSIWGGTNSVIFEGATADAFETTLTLGDPTADQTITIPATAGAAGTVALNGATVVITAGASPTLTVPLGVNFIATDTITTDNQDQTITFSSGGSVGQVGTVIFQTDSGGSNDEIMTFQTTLTNTTGTLTLANLTANRYSIRFQSDGTVWNEVSRTGAQT